MGGYTITGISAVCYRPEPENSRRDSRVPHQMFKDNASVHTPAEYFAILGDISIKTSGQNSDFPLSSSWLVEAQYVKFASDSQGTKTLSAKIIWKLKDGNDSVFPQYNILSWETSKTGSRNVEGTSQNLDKSPFLLLDVKDK
ncbi:hypothetical protein CUMW_052340 [Citrus unshiu]|nr:hypothetical protein CUMW_052340 [Citrus unshiu]